MLNPHDGKFAIVCEDNRQLEEVLSMLRILGFPMGSWETDFLEEGPHSEYEPSEWLVPFYRGPWSHVACYRTRKNVPGEYTIYGYKDFMELCYGNEEELDEADLDELMNFIWED